MYNLGSGKGHSNLEVVKMIENVSGLKLDIKYSDARIGDPPVIYANYNKAKKELGFVPKYSDLETIVKTTYKWYINNPFPVPES